MTRVPSVKRSHFKLARMSLAIVAGATTALTGLSLDLPTAQAQQFAVEEIVVTARRRAESLQDIPLAITAFSAQDIEDAGIQGLQDLAFFFWE